MRGLFPSALILTIVLPAFLSCKAISSAFDNDRAVAKVGQHKLTHGEVASLVPKGTSPEDSMRLVMQYINSWASDLVYADIAEAKLSKQEKDVSRELEEYRKALLKYRYEQRYVNERLDTSITDDELQEYYDSHAQDFIASVPVVKARFMRISADSPAIEIFRKKIVSDNLADMVYADSLAYSAADKFTDYGGKWIPAPDLARDFGKDCESLMSMMKNSFIEIRDRDYDKLDIAYVSDYVRAGEPLPLEYCAPDIKEILIGIRRHRLVTELEQDLLDDARKKGKFVIY